MKKITFTIILSVLFSWITAQDLELYYGDDLLNATAILNLTAHPDSGVMVLDEIGVKNISADPLMILCAREIIELVPGSVNSFCWGLCYPPNVDTSSLNIKIDGGDMSMEFQGDHDPAGFTGVSTIKYTFYELGNPDNNASFTVNYGASDELAVSAADAIELSNAYPNPANKFVQLDYDLKKVSANSHLVIYNLLGNVVKNIAIAEPMGSLKVNTSDLTEGIYFYSLLVNNESLTTHKLIIKH
ncbi:MAG: T9SS type A sorting domain-containing protein [Bacteroidetes bacterium]|nr:T9SS type A sorting domain-containing protein [Bacteroidota bacterium]